MPQETQNIKLVVVGDQSVGKTCLLISYTQDKFPTDHVETVFQNYTAKVRMDNKMLQLGLWDTAGQQKYSRLRPLSYHCDVFLIVFSVVDVSSFLNACKKWYKQLQQHVRADVPRIFVGNKIDLRDQYVLTKEYPKGTLILQESARRVIEKDFKCKYMECSALTQDGLRPVFDEAMRSVLRKRMKPVVKKVDQDLFCNLI